MGPHTSVVVDLSALAEPNKVDYLQRLRLAAEAHREQRGVPHWVIYDEAHLLGTHEEAPWTRRGGIDSTDVVLELTGADTAEEIAERTVRRATVRFGSGPSRPFTIADRRTFSRWLNNTIADKELAAQVAAWEDQLLAHRAADLERIRHQLVQAMEERYLGADEHD